MPSPTGPQQHGVRGGAGGAYESRAGPAGSTNVAGAQSQDEPVSDAPKSDSPEDGEIFE